MSSYCSMARTKQTARVPHGGTVGKANRVTNPLPTNHPRQSNNMSKKDQTIRTKKRVLPSGRRQKPKISHLPTKKPHCYCPGTIALWEIYRYQFTSELLICKAPFSCLVYEITHGITKKVNITALFEDSNLVCIHSKRVTVMPKDARLIR